MLPDPTIHRSNIIPGFVFQIKAQGESISSILMAKKRKQHKGSPCAAFEDILFVTDSAQIVFAADAHPIEGAVGKEKA